ncbi:MAG: hypothetical protein MI807_11040 [Verrucomicrobiales bacterium]|nr:hypothetical protein [Verrucomicrobiales bacterium]
MKTRFYLSVLGLLLANCLLAQKFERSSFFPKVPTEMKVSNATYSPTLFLMGRVQSVSDDVSVFRASLDDEIFEKHLFKVVVVVDELLVTGPHIFDYGISEHLFSDKVVEFECYFEEKPDINTKSIPIVLQYFPSTHAKVARKIYQFDTRQSMMEALGERQKLRIRMKEEFPNEILF